MACYLNRLTQQSFEGRRHTERADDTSLPATAHVASALVNKLPFKQHIYFAEEILRRYVDVQTGRGQRRTAQRRHEQLTSKERSRRRNMRRIIEASDYRLRRLNPSAIRN
jgi:hypothetical protein